jgi:uncharacterized protein
MRQVEVYLLDGVRGPKMLSTREDRLMRFGTAWIVVLTLAATGMARNKPDISGEWFGELPLPNEWQLLQLHIEGGTQEIKGSLDLPLREAMNVPLKKVRWSTTEVAFEASTPLGDLEFQGNSRDGRLEGVVKGLKSAEPRASFRLARLAKIEFAPYTGGYETDDGRLIAIAPWIEQTIGLTTLSVAYSDTLTGRAGSLFPLSATRFVSGGPGARIFPVELEVLFEMDREGKITGLTWQEASSKKVHARKVDCYHEEQVKFKNKDVTLAGTLLVPRGPGPHPAIILTHGSGPQRRWRGIFEQLWSRRGVAVLSYDKRGVGQSTGDWHQSSFLDLADDAVSAAQFLQKRGDIDGKRIGFWGLSQGGWIAPLAASRFGRTAFVIFAAGGGLSPEQQELLDTEAELHDAKFSEGDIAAAIEFQKAKNAFMRTGASWEGYQKLRQTATKKDWYGFGNTDAWGPESKEDPYWASCRLIYFYDPAPALQSLRCPVLFISGAQDTPKAVKENVVNIQKWLQQAGNQGLTIKVFPNAGHNLFVNEPGLLEMLTTARLRYAPGYLDLVESWVVQRAAPRK